MFLTYQLKIPFKIYVKDTMKKSVFLCGLLVVVKRYLLVTWNKHCVKVVP